ncbi:MAG: WD40 repeat domain-containing protein [Candidatus Xenobiia bacterium LiM19]
MRIFCIFLLLMMGFMSFQPAHADGPAMLNVMNVSFSADGTVLAVAGTGKGERFKSPGRVELWNVKTQRLICSLQESKAVTAAAFRPDGKVILTGSENKNVALWSVPAGKRLLSLSGARTQVWGVAFSPDGKKAAAACGWDSGQVLVWDAGKGTSLFSISDKTDGYYSVRFSPDGKMLAAGDRTGRVILVDASTGSKIRVWKDLPGWATTLCFNSKGSILAAGGGSEIHLYDTAGGALQRSFKTEWSCTSLDFFPGDRQMLIGRWNSGVAPSNGDVAVWDADSGNKISTMGKSDGRVCSDLSPDGKMVAAGYEYKKFSAKILEASTGKVLYTLGGR